MCIDKFSHLISQAVDKGDWIAARAGRGGSFVSHLMFADDLLLFGEAKDIWCEVMRGKYQRGTEIQIDVDIAKPADSHLWKIIVKFWPQ
jgi:hypothetical protein